MINAAELRIGNIIKSIAYVEGGNATTDIVVHWDLLRQIITETCIFEYKPIEITEDWLIRGGFEIKENDSMRWFEIIIIGRDFVVDKIRHGWYLSFKTSPDKLQMICKLPYLHTLQNVVFALSGTELTFTA